MKKLQGTFDKIQVLGNTFKLIIKSATNPFASNEPTEKH